MYKEDLFKEHYDEIRECVINAIVEQCFTGIAQSVVLWSDGDVDFYTSDCGNYLGYFNTVEGVVLYTSFGKKEYVEEEFDGEEDFRDWCRDFIEGEIIKDIMYDIEMKLLTEDLCMDYLKERS